MFKKFIVFFIGIIFAVSILELSLSIYGKINPSKKQVDRTFVEKQLLTIQFLGDSFTFGLGASPGNSITQQLKRQISKIYPQKKISIINSAMYSYNTAHVLDDLENDLNRVRPDIVFLLAGGTNKMMSWGKDRYTEAEIGWRQLLMDRLKQTHSYKLVSILAYQIKNKYFRGEVLVKNYQDKSVRTHFNRTNGYYRQEADGKPADISRSINVQKEIVEDFFNIQNEDQGELNIDSHELLRLCKKKNQEKKINQYYYSCMGVAYIHQKEFITAREYFQKGMSNNPHHTYNYHGLIYLDILEERLTSALKMTQKVRSIAPINVRQAQRLIWQNGGSGNSYQKFLSFIKGILSIVDCSGELSLFLGLQYELNEDPQEQFIKVEGRFIHKTAVEFYNKAIKCFKMDIQQDPTNMDNYIIIGDIYRHMMIKDSNIWYHKALAKFEKMLNQKSTLIDPYLGMAIVYKSMGDHINALKWYQNAVKNEPQNRQRENALLALVMQIGAYEEGLHFFKKYLSYNQNFTMPIIKIYLEIGNYDQALVWLDKVRTINQEQYYWFAGKIYQGQGKNKEALKFYQRSLNSSGSPNQYLYIPLAQVCDNLGKHQEALDYYQKALSLEKNNKIYVSIGRIMAKMGRFHQAMQAFKQSGSNPWTLMGSFYVESGEYKKALQMYKTGISENFNFVDNYFGIYKVFLSGHKDEGDLKDAISYFKELKTPHANLYLEALQRLYKISRFDPQIKDVYEWIRADLERIVKICKRKGVKRIVMHTYPFHDYVNDIIKNVAKKYSIPFVDHTKAFDLLWEKGEPLSDYYADDGHCNDKGYAIMAKNILNFLSPLLVGK